MDKYATLAVCFLLVLSGVTEIVCLANADGTYVLGYSAIGSDATGGGNVLGYEVNLTVPEGYKATLSEVRVYLTNVSAGENAHVGVMDATYGLLWDSGNFTINGLGWYNETCDLTLLDGTYWLVVSCDEDGRAYFSTIASAEARIVGGYSFNQLLSSSWGTYSISLYGVYTYTNLVETSELAVNWMAFIVLIVFALLNVVLMLAPRIYVLNFVVGALTLAFSAATANDSTLPIQPYFSLIVALLATLGILRAANLLRNG